METLAVSATLPRSTEQLPQNQFTPREDLNSEVRFTSAIPFSPPKRPSEESQGATNHVQEQIKSSPRQASPSPSTISSLTSLSGSPAPIPVDGVIGPVERPSKRRRLTPAEKEVREKEKAVKKARQEEERVRREEDKRQKMEERRQKNEALEEKKREKELKRQEKEQKKQEEENEKERKERVSITELNTQHSAHQGTNRHNHVSTPFFSSRHRTVSPEAHPELRLRTALLQNQARPMLVPKTLLPEPVVRIQITLRHFFRLPRHRVQKSHLRTASPAIQKLQDLLVAMQTHGLF